MINRRQFLGAASAFAVAGTPLRAQASLQVVATTGMIADTAKVIGGDLVQVAGMMGSGIDPHSYRQTRSDIVDMVRADLTLWHGLYLEAQMEEFFAALDRKRAVTPVAEAVPVALRLAHEDYQNRFDPHVWMDPSLWIYVAREIGRTMGDQVPEHAQALQQRAEDYVAELTALRAYADDVLSTVPQEARVLVSAHDAFRYFGRAFGYEVLGVQGISTESEAGLNRIGQLVDVLVQRQVGAVFIESSVSERNVRALIEGAAARGHEVRIGGQLFSDAMGPAGTYEGTYLGMIDYNVTQIARALGGTAPDRGYRGKLQQEGSNA